MKIAVPAEADKAETRVAATPETVKKFIALGAEVAVQSGAGAGARITDQDFTAGGATIAKTAAATLKDADIVLKVRRPVEAELKSYKPGAIVVAIMDPYGNEAALKAIADAKLVPDPDAVIRRFGPEFEKLLYLALMGNWDYTLDAGAAESLLEETPLAS